MAIRYIARNLPEDRAASSMARLRGIARHTSEINPAAAVERDARALAAKMRAIHGGEWVMLIDHQRRAVLIWEERG